MTIFATFKADSAERLNRASPAARVEIPCSAPQISLFRLRRENRQNLNRLFSNQNCQKRRSAKLEKKKKFPVPAPEQGNSPADDRPEKTRGNAPPQPESSPDSYQLAYAEQARKLCAHGLSEVDVADFLEVTPATLRGWRRHHPDFAAALANGKAAADNRVELSLYQRAIGYDRQVEKVFTPARAEEPIRVMVRERVPGDPRAAIAWLRIRCPEKWGSPREPARARRQSREPAACPDPVDKAHGVVAAARGAEVTRPGVRKAGAPDRIRTCGLCLRSA